MSQIWNIAAEQNSAR